MASEASSSISVGQRLRDAAIVGYNSPAYRDVASAVSAEVSSRVQSEMVKRSRAIPVVMTQILSPELAEELSQEFPEIRLVNYGMDRLGHESYQAYSYLMNELMLIHASKFTNSAVHLGGRVMSSLMVKDLAVHIELDTNVPSAVHARMRDIRNTNRVLGDYAVLSREGDFAYARHRYEEYLARRDYVACSKVDCHKKAGVYLADVSQYAISPTQFVAGAIQCDADVAIAFFPYHPIMLMQDKGEIPGTGVHYEKDFDMQVLRMKYPQGVSGAEIFSLAHWAAWLTEHVVQVGRGSSRREYHFQLIKRRGPFMMVQAVRAATLSKESSVLDWLPQVSRKEPEVQLRHALDLELQEQAYVVRGWTLKNLATDPGEESSWSSVCFMAPRKVVDAVYAFGMQLPAESFSRYAIRRQYTMYDRVTVEGSSVTRGYKPSTAHLDILTSVTYAELFVKRYESGMLSKELMARLKGVAGFADAGFLARFKAVATWCVMYVWHATLGRVLEGFSQMCQWIEDFFVGKVDKQPSFQLAPERLTFETVVGGWRATRASEYRQAVQSLTSFSHDSKISLRGGLLSRKIAALENVSHGVSKDNLRTVAEMPMGRIFMDDGVSSKTLAGEVGETPERTQLMNKLKEQNQMDQAGPLRHFMPTMVSERLADPDKGGLPDQDVDPQFVTTMNEVYAEFNPELVRQDITVDVASISHDPQDRQLHADRLRLPRVFTAQPKDKEYFRSKIKALGAPKRQETGPELLSSMAARNLAAPKVSLPQDNSKIIPEIWETFLNRMCVSDARDKLRMYAEDPAALEETAYNDWMSQARPEVIQRVARQIDECDTPMLEQDVGKYLMMLKADVKPPLSDKPVRSRIEPQVIVYHDKAVSSMYSAVFRVLVRRFLSLLKPNVHVNLLKDMDDIQQFLQGVHPFGTAMRYVENDFSKYDKSQDAFVFELEQYVFRALGMNEALLKRWVAGHEECRLRSFTTGISLHVRFQRKSGDATTAFGNVLLNILSVSYAYGISDFVWALFMGDDSLIATASTAIDGRAVSILGEVFNLMAKTYITDQPYFASWFFLFWDERKKVIGLPDPIKRVEKWSQAISAVDPQWSERYDGARQTCKPYAYKANTRWLGKMVSQRYMVSEESANRLPAAIYTAVKSEQNFRNMYEAEPEWFRY
uniref:RNA-dependent RNA polymerase n=1 Tax=Grapevine-associated virga-like virus 3 TaxID=2814375 RepID=A0A8F5ML15_9VIRU|nr:MAG: RNA-dependent RNA polymerase [Grapevine-associated virga-like virus 3]